jgi:hypothetical protein
MKIEPVRAKAQSFGDAAINGLIGGLIAGGAMILVILVTGLLVGEEPAAILAGFDVGQAAVPLAGGLTHLGVSRVYGVGYGLLLYLLPARWFRRIPGWLAGLAFAGALLLIAVSILLPGLASPLAGLPLWALVAGHAAYGLVLGWRAG